MGNILFLVGVTLLLGAQRTFIFFARRQKWKGSLAFWAGILLILMRWTFIGFAVECYGIFSLFGEFFKQVSASKLYGAGKWLITRRLLVSHTACPLSAHTLPKDYKWLERKPAQMDERTKTYRCRFDLPPSIQARICANVRRIILIEPQSASLSLLCKSCSVHDIGWVWDWPW